MVRVERRRPADSVVLNDIRDQALAEMAGGEDRSLYYAEWSADPKLDVDDRARLGARPTRPSATSSSEETIAARLKTDPRQRVQDRGALPLGRRPRLALAAERLGRLCRRPTSRSSRTRPTFLAIDVSLDRRHAALVAVQQLDGGRLGAHLLQTWEADGAIDDLEIAGAVAPIARKLRARSVAFDRYTAISHRAAARSVGIPIGDCSGAAFSQACDETLSSMVAGRLVHGAQETLTEHVLGCAKKTTSRRRVAHRPQGLLRHDRRRRRDGHGHSTMPTKPVPKAEMYFA